MVTEVIGRSEVELAVMVGDGGTDEQVATRGLEALRSQSNGIASRIDGRGFDRVWSHDGPLRRAGMVLVNVLLEVDAGPEPQDTVERARQVVGDVDGPWTVRVGGREVTVTLGEGTK